ncbi:hypothetical protein L6259_01380 [Candidatus Parcubacteria bacterium]|nr:hypothetical protein [Candidatus Parcubacteria bacterium]
MARLIDEISLGCSSDLHHSSFAVYYLTTAEIPFYLEEYLAEITALAGEVSSVQAIVEVMLYELGQARPLPDYYRQKWLSALRYFCRKFSVAYLLDNIKLSANPSSQNGNQSEKKENISCTSNPRGDFPYAI